MLLRFNCKRCKGRPNAYRLDEEQKRVASARQWMRQLATRLHEVSGKAPRLIWEAAVDHRANRMRSMLDQMISDFQQPTKRNRIKANVICLVGKQLEVLETIDTRQLKTLHAAQLAAHYGV
jgi:late competence protein required for DNA uptake (superfamily II DNA/RNA helicase)